MSDKASACRMASLSDEDTFSRPYPRPNRPVSGCQKLLSFLSISIGMTVSPTVYNEAVGENVESAPSCELRSIVDPSPRG